MMASEKTGAALRASSEKSGWWELMGTAAAKAAKPKTAIAITDLDIERQAILDRPRAAFAERLKILKEVRWGTSSFRVDRSRFLINEVGSTYSSLSTGLSSDFVFCRAHRRKATKREGL